MEQFNLQNHCWKTWQRIAVEEANNGRGWFWLLLMKKKRKGMLLCAAKIEVVRVRR